MDRGQPWSKLHYLPPAATRKKENGIVSTLLVRLNVTPVQKRQPNHRVSRFHFSPLAESHRRALLTFGAGAWQEVQHASISVAFLFYLVFLLFCFGRTLCTFEAAGRVRDSRGDRRDLGNKKKWGMFINLVKVQPVTVSATHASLTIIWHFHLLLFLWK